MLSLLHWHAAFLMTPNKKGFQDSAGCDPVSYGAQGTLGT